jgi:transcriptional regulator with XRE-family HTH domain
VKPSQVRMARAALNWSLQQLAEAAGVHRNTISNFEIGKYAGDPQTLTAIESALEAAGVEFTNGKQPGVRLTLVGALYLLADEADLDAVLRMKGMKADTGGIARAGKTPWNIVRTQNGLECHNNKGTTLGTVTARAEGLVFDPEMRGSPYDDMPDTTKLQNWIGLVMERDAERHRSSR